MRTCISLLVLILLGAPAAADSADARRLLARALAARDAAGLDAALKADSDKTAFRLALRPRDYAALSRFVRDSEAAREILRRSVGDGVHLPLDIEGPLTVEVVERNAVRAGSPPALALSALLYSDDLDLASAAATRLAEMGDARAIPPMKDLFDRTRGREPRVVKAWVQLTERYPRARGRPAAALWQRLAEATFAGQFERGTASALYEWAGGLVVSPVAVEVYELELAMRAATRALEREPDLLEAGALELRTVAARNLTEEAMAAAGAGSFYTSFPTGVMRRSPLVLAVAIDDARRFGEHEIVAWLFGLTDGRARRHALPEIARALGEDDGFVRDAALEALSRIDAAAPMSDEDVAALIEGARARDAGAAEAAVQMLSGANLTNAQRLNLERSIPPILATESATEREPTLVTVYYGTDRAETSPDAAFYLQRFAPTAAALLLALLLPPVVRWLFHPRIARLARIAKYGCLAATLVFLVLGIYGSIRTAKRHDRLGVEYGGERGPFDSPDGPYCHFGTCVVGIPPGHETGEVERPGLLTGEPWEDPEEHVMLLTITAGSKDEFLGELEEAGREKAFVFVHGFNVAFDDAALRTAQMAHDLEYSGAPIFFSWPSRAKVMSYTVDESTVAWATRHLKEFLRDVRRTVPDATIHLVAHSMGNRALTEALRRLAAEVEAEELPRFQEVVLAAPDIDAATFRDDIAPAIRPAAERVTLYASAYDRALAASKEVHGYPRAGDAAGGVVTVRGIQSIEVDVEDLDLLGHSYYGSAGHMIDDLVALLLYRRHPEHRGLERVGEGVRSFWRLR